MKSLLGEVDVASVNNFKDPNTFENKRELIVEDFLNYVCIIC